MENNNPPFIWTLFIDEGDAGAGQVMYFTHDVCFIEVLSETGFLTPDEASIVSLADVDLRFGDQAPYPSSLSEFTIFI